MYVINEQETMCCVVFASVELTDHLNWAWCLEIHSLEITPSDNSIELIIFIMIIIIILVKRSFE